MNVPAFIHTTENIHTHAYISIFHWHAMRRLWRFKRAYQVRGQQWVVAATVAATRGSRWLAAVTVMYDICIYHNLQSIERFSIAIYWSIWSGTRTERPWIMQENETAIGRRVCVCTADGLEVRLFLFTAPLSFCTRAVQRSHAYMHKDTHAQALTRACPCQLRCQRQQLQLVVQQQQQQQNKAAKVLRELLKSASATFTINKHDKNWTSPKQKQVSNTKKKQGNKTTATTCCISLDALL